MASVLESFESPAGLLPFPSRLTPAGVKLVPLKLFKVTVEVSWYHSRAGTHRSRATSFEGQRTFSAFQEGVVQGRQKRDGEGS